MDDIRRQFEDYCESIKSYCKVKTGAYDMIRGQLKQEEYDDIYEIKRECTSDLVMLYNKRTGEFFLFKKNDIIFE